ncbi:MAG: alpha/beta hydrolase family protein [Cellvibrionaceae bacterium]
MPNAKINFYLRRIITAAGILSAVVIPLKAMAAQTAAISPEKVHNPDRELFLPSLASRGGHSVGVKTLSLVNPQQLNVNSKTLTDRELTVELWYPTKDHQQHSQYDNVTRLGKPFSLYANAKRDAEIKTNIEVRHQQRDDNTPNSRYPLVIFSHGYTGYRSLMFYLAEHLASHGYIVAGIDHTDSTNADVSAENPRSGFLSTLYNRSRDQQFVRQQLLSKSSPVERAVNPLATGLVGYSMGGYGLIASIGGCYHFSEAALKGMSPEASAEEVSQAQQLLNTCQLPPQAPWQAAVAMAPWGNQLGVFDQQRLASIRTPLLTISGDLDDVSIYSSIRKLHEAVGSEHKHLLTYLNARHNIAPHPAPRVAHEHEYDLGHYFEPAWDLHQINAINQHVTLAMMDCHLKQRASACELLELQGLASDGDGWKGFPKRFTTGLRWE